MPGAESAAVPSLYLGQLCSRHGLLRNSRWVVNRTLLSCSFPARLCRVCPKPAANRFSRTMSDSYIWISRPSTLVLKSCPNPHRSVVLSSQKFERFTSDVAVAPDNSDKLPISSNHVPSSSAEHPLEMRLRTDDTTHRNCLSTSSRCS